MPQSAYKAFKNCQILQVEHKNILKFKFFMPNDAFKIPHMSIADFKMCKCRIPPDYNPPPNAVDFYSRDFLENHTYNVGIDEAKRLP